MMAFPWGLETLYYLLIQMFFEIVSSFMYVSEDTIVLNKRVDLYVH